MEEPRVTQQITETNTHTVIKRKTKSMKCHESFPLPCNQHELLHADSTYREKKDLDIRLGFQLEISVDRRSVLYVELLY